MEVMIAIDTDNNSLRMMRMKRTVRMGEVIKEVKEEAIEEDMEERTGVMNQITRKMRILLQLLEVVGKEMLWRKKSRVWCRLFSGFIVVEHLLIAEKRKTSNIDRVNPDK
jgi:hypothetical protein